MKHWNWCGSLHRRFIAIAINKAVGCAEGVTLHFHLSAVMYASEENHWSAKNNRTQEVQRLLGLEHSETPDAIMETFFNRPYTKQTSFGLYTDTYFTEKTLSSIINSLCTAWSVRLAICTSSATARTGNTDPSSIQVNLILKGLSILSFHQHGWIYRSVRLHMYVGHVCWEPFKPRVDTVERQRGRYLVVIAHISPIRHLKRRGIVLN